MQELSSIKDISYFDIDHEGFNKMNDTSLFDAVLKSLDKHNSFKLLPEDKRPTSASGNSNFPHPFVKVDFENIKNLVGADLWLIIKDSLPF